MGRVSEVLIDTHVFAWSLIDPDRLSGSVRQAIEAATTTVPPCAFHEITLKVRRGGWDAMAPYIDRLDRLAKDQNFKIAPYTAKMAMLAGSLEWHHRDPFDRMIAATAIELATPLVSADPAFDDLSALSGWPGRIWAA